jgi:hypothetical protein
MKRVILVALLAFLASYSWSGYPLASAGFAGNGDHNGDEALDLSDAVYLLAHLFQGGPAPLPCPGIGGGAAVTPGMAIGAGGGGAPDPELPATGQGFCRDSNGTETSCATSECSGQDGDLQIGCPMEGRFVILPGPNGVVDPVEDPGDPGISIPAVDDTVFDRCTGLEWQRSTADTGQEGSLVPDGVLDGHDRRSWPDALQYCEDLTFATHSDWRLPNFMELQSIVDYNGVGVVQNQTLIDDAFTLGKYRVSANTCSIHWTSTPRPACSTGPNQRCTLSMTPDILRAVYVGFNGPTAGGTGQGRLIVNNSNPPEYTIYLVRAVRRGTINAGAGGGVAEGRGAGVSGNGDVNGDLSIDLSDAIYLLAFLFQGGSIPEPCPEIAETDCVGGNCCGNNVDDDSDGSTDCDDTDCVADAICLGAPEVCNNATDDDLDGDTDCADADCVLDPSCDIASPLPVTGVTSCYDENGGSIPCAGTGQDAEYQAGGCTLTGAARFVHNLGPDGMDDMTGGSGTLMPVDDTITDMCTGLEWQRVRHDVNGNGTIGNGAPGPEGDAGPEGDNIPWCEAVEYCELTLNSDGGFAGKTGWRFPNVRETHSLLLYGRPVQMNVELETLIDPLFGSRVTGACSSTLSAGGTYGTLYHTGGITTACAKPHNVVTVRAVRTADSP